MLHVIVFALIAQVGVHIGTDSMALGLATYFAIMAVYYSIHPPTN